MPSKDRRQRRSNAGLPVYAIAGALLILALLQLGGSHQQHQQDAAGGGGAAGAAAAGGLRGVRGTLRGVGAAAGGEPRIITSVALSAVANFSGASDPSILYYKGHFVAAFSTGFGMPSEAGLAYSTDGTNWVMGPVIPGFKWTSLLAHRDRLYLLGTEGILWERTNSSANDLQAVALTDPPELKPRTRAKLTSGLAIHASNAPALVTTGDRVILPFMVAAAGQFWNRIRVSGFRWPPPAVLGEGLVPLPALGEDVSAIGPADWDRTVFGVAVYGNNAGLLGAGTFVRLEQGGGAVYARVVAVEGAERWDFPTVLFMVPQRWNTTCSGLELSKFVCKPSLATYSEGEPIMLTASLVELFPDAPLYQEFFLGVLQTRLPLSPLLSLADPASWEFRTPMVGDPLAAHPAAHKVWAGSHVQERAADGRLRSCAAAGPGECVYWQEPIAFDSRNASRFHVAVRLTSDVNCNLGLLCGADVGTAGSEVLEHLDCGTLTPLPGFGNVRGWVGFDRETDLYWAVNNFNVNAARAAARGKAFSRTGQRCLNERGNLGLYFSADLHNWFLAKTLARATPGAGLHLMYVNCGIAGEDLVCIARTNGELRSEREIFSAWGDNHESRLVVAFQVEGFRALADLEPL